ncbi:hypothetical protein CBL_07238 [Carabus blaptoides fortunei]
MLIGRCGMLTVRDRHRAGGTRIHRVSSRNVTSVADITRLSFHYRNVSNVQAEQTPAGSFGSRPRDHYSCMHKSVRILNICTGRQTRTDKHEQAHNHEPTTHDDIRGWTARTVTYRCRNDGREHMEGGRGIVSGSGRYKWQPPTHLLANEHT